MMADSGVRLRAGDHVVQCYDADDELVGVVVGYLAAALRDGDSVIVIATPSHRAAFEATLASAGIDTASVQHDARLVLVDAAQLLSRFMTGDTPDPEAFDLVVGELVRQVGARGRPVRAYGEMVALLWANGNASGATDLEQHWNTLGATTPFSLFCAYPTRLVGTIDDAESLEELCKLHSDVVAGAPIPGDCDISRRFVRTSHAPTLARRFVTKTLQGWGQDELIDDSLLVVSELTANAITHAASDVTVSLVRHAHGVRLTVGDSSTAAPTPRQSDVTTYGGRGLTLVHALAARWGYQSADEGKYVWADIDGR